MHVIGSRFKMALNVTAGQLNAVISWMSRRMSQSPSRCIKRQLENEPTEAIHLAGLKQCISVVDSWSFTLPSKRGYLYSGVSDSLRPK